MNRSDLCYLWAVNDVVPIEQYKALEAKFLALQHELEQLKRLIFGSKRERFVPAVAAEQLMLDFGQSEEVVEAEAAATETISYTRKKVAHPGRTVLPDHLPTEEVILEPEEDTTGMKLIGEEITETIDYRPGVLFKRRVIRRKYARMTPVEGETSVVIAPLPERPIPKGIAEAGLLAYLIVSKYLDHLPFYRQIERFKREHNWVLQKTTLNDWFAACCMLLEPLSQRLMERTLDSDYLQADESPIKVLDKDSPGSTHQGYMWVYRNPVNGLVFFDYRKGRGMHGPKERLAGFKGLLQCDGYKVYDSLAAKQPDVRLVSCLAHIRRKFFEAKENSPKKATEALSRIGQLYDLERTYREEGCHPEQIAARRQVEARPLFEGLLEWVKEEYGNNLSTENIGKALRYASQQLPRLEPYLSDGRIQIDNNLIENAIRPLALGRKNYLFAGAHSGAERTAMIYSFLASCKTLEVNPLEWMTDVLQRVGSHPVNRIDELLPGNWKKLEV